MTDAPPTEQNWHRSSPAAVRIWLRHLTEKANPANLEGMAGDWTGEEDRADEHLPSVLRYADASGEIEVRIKPAAVYRPTL